MYYDQAYYRTIWHNILEKYTIHAPIRDFGDITRAALVAHILRQTVFPALQKQERYCLHDYGAGNWLYLGELFQVCASQPARIFLKGVDYSQEALSFASLKFHSQQPANVELQIQESDILEALVEQKDASVDCVLCLETLEHVYADEEIFRQYGRILRPGGFLIVSVPNTQPFFLSQNWFSYRFFRQRFTEKDRVVGHVRRYSVTSLLALSSGTDAAARLIIPYGFFLSDYFKRMIAWLDEHIPALGKLLFPLCTRLLFLEHHWWNSLQVRSSEGFFAVFQKHA
jgi:2-polyprenyl-3-methyl-5-hydroxy-6-metoxy-1,4-benzoquinol methylase